MPATADETEAPRAEDETTVRRNEEAGRYEVWVGDVLAGFTEFRADSRGRQRFPHTEVDPAFRGRGLAQILVGQAMADTAERGETVVPLCPLVAKYLRDNEVDGLDVSWPAGTASD